MADTNQSPDKTPWYQSEAFKTALTILVILMIPVAAFGWNLWSGKGSVSDIKDAFNISSADTKNTDGENSGDLKDDPNNTDNKDQANNTTDKNQNNNGKKMPNTAASEIYTVKDGDTLKSISLSQCKDSSDPLRYYYNNISKEIKVGDKLKVNCNY